MGFRAKNVILGCVALAALIVDSDTYALTFTGAGPGNNPGQTLQASATFVVSNLDLVVTLSNDATFDPNDAPDILTGVFFAIEGDPALTPVSAMVGPGSLMIDHRPLSGFTPRIHNSRSASVRCAMTTPVRSFQMKLTPHPLLTGC